MALSNFMVGCIICFILAVLYMIGNIAANRIILILERKLFKNQKKRDDLE